MTAAPDPEVVRGIGEHPLFRGLDAAFVHAVAEQATERRFAIDERLATEGAPAEVFYLVTDGKVALEIGSADQPHLTVETVGAGEVLGWSWLVPPHRWRFDARAVKATRTVVLQGEVVRRTLAHHPTWGYLFLVRFMPVLADRLENTRVQLLDLHAR